MRTVTYTDGSPILKGDRVFVADCGYRKEGIVFLVMKGMVWVEKRCGMVVMLPPEEVERFFRYHTRSEVRRQRREEMYLTRYQVRKETGR